MAEVGDGSSAEDDSDGGDDAVPVLVVLMLMPGLMFGLGRGRCWLCSCKTSATLTCFLQYSGRGKRGQFNKFVELATAVGP